MDAGLVEDSNKLLAAAAGEVIRKKSTIADDDADGHGRNLAV